MKIVIGIISYLPDDTGRRNVRSELVSNLVQRCKELFDLPIIIVAQNWKDKNIESKDITIYRYDNPLTIVGARKELRRIFLESEYDYLIMLDDDCKLYGTSAENYLRQIYENPDCWIEKQGSVLKLFAISKSVFAQVDYDDVSLEREEGFEDWVFFAKLRKLIPPEKHKKFQNCKVWEKSYCTGDPYSTWFKNQPLTEIVKKTHDHINQYIKEKPE